MFYAQHWDTYFTYPQSKTGGEGEDFPNQMREPFIAMGQSVTRYVCCSGFWDGWHLVAGRERGKSGSFHPFPLKADRGNSSGSSTGTSDMHNNKKTACRNTGGLTTAAEWETDVCTFFYPNTSSLRAFYTTWPTDWWAMWMFQTVTLPMIDWRTTLCSGQ